MRITAGTTFRLNGAFNPTLTTGCTPSTGTGTPGIPAFVAAYPN